jgi:hypothetical protein
VIANAGGLKPRSLRRRRAQAGGRAGPAAEVAVVGATTILPRKDALRAPEMFTGAACRRSS